MSSEMRDEIACEIVRNVCETDPADPDAPMTVCIDVTRLREIVDNALLARTEAGADGAVAYRVRRGNGSWGIPHEYLPGSPATIAALCDEGCEVQYLHPQDASGDAVAELIAAADVLNTGAKHGLSTYPEDWKRLDAALDAMQAKEAK